MNEVDLERLNELCERGLSALGLELVELEYRRDRSGWVLRVFIDHPPDPQPERKPGGGAGSLITHEDCEQASRQLGTMLDVEDIIPTAYRLEVSSPGIPRPLRKERDFKRFAGELIRVEMRDPLGGRRSFRGRIRTVADGMLEVEADGSCHQLPLAGIRRARLATEQ